MSAMRRESGAPRTSVWGITTLSGPAEFSGIRWQDSAKQSFACRTKLAGVGTFFPSLGRREKLNADQFTAVVKLCGLHHCMQ